MNLFARSPLKVAHPLLEVALASCEATPNHPIQDGVEADEPRQEGKSEKCHNYPDDQQGEQDDENNKHTSFKPLPTA